MSLVLPCASELFIVSLPTRYTCAELMESLEEASAWKYCSIFLRYSVKTSMSPMLFAHDTAIQFSTFMT